MAGWTISGGGQAPTSFGTANSMPGRGLVQFFQSLTGTTSATDGGGTSCSAQPCVDSYYRYKWSQLEGAMGDYSAGFALIDSHLANAATRGGRHTIRVMALWGGHSDMLPAYIMGNPAYNTYTMGYAAANDTVVPDWNNVLFLARAQALLAAYGARYNGDVRLKEVQLGLYGAFGEFHTALFPAGGPNGQLPITDANKLAIIDMHYAAFTRTRIMVTTSENRAATYAFSKAVAVPSGAFRDSIGDSTFLDIDQDNASTGSVGQHNNCLLAEWVDDSTAVFVPGITYNDQSHVLQGSYNIKAVLQSSAACNISLGFRKVGAYPIQAFDIGTANPYGATCLQIAMRGEGSGLASERVQPKFNLTGIGASAHATIDGSGHVSGAVLDAAGQSYQNPTISVVAVGTGGGSGATFNNPTADPTSGAITALGSLSAGGSAYISPPSLQINDSGAFTNSIGMFAATAYHNESGGSIGGRVLQSNAWTYYTYSLDSFFTGARPAHAYISNLILELLGTRTSGDIVYIGEILFNTGFGTAPVYTIYDGTLPGLPGAWRSYVQNLWKTAPFHAEPFGASASLTNTTGGINAQVNTYHVATVANGAMAAYSGLTTQQKADWDNLNSGAEYGSASLYSAAGYQIQYRAIAAPAQVYPGVAFVVSGFWANLGSAPCYEGLALTWQFLDGSTVVYSQPSKINLLSLAPMCGVSPATWTYAQDIITLPASVPAHSLVVQLVATHPNIPGFSVTLASLLTLTPA